MYFLEIIKTIASMATPIVVAIFGFLLLYRIERVKAEVAKQSEFDKKWAEQFFECCQEFMSCLERYVSVLNWFQISEVPFKVEDEFKAKSQKEILCLHNDLVQLGLRVERSVVFALKNGLSATKTAKKCITLTTNLVNSKQGSFDVILKEMNEFNIAAREAHAEMLIVGAD